VLITRSSSSSSSRRRGIDGKLQASSLTTDGVIFRQVWSLAHACTVGRLLYSGASLVAASSTQGAISPSHSGMCHLVPVMLLT
jgi:hypothetical protein